MEFQRTPESGRAESHATRDTKGRHLLRAAIVGLVTGLLAVAFRRALYFAEASRGELIEFLRGLPHAAWWAWIVLPAIGLVVGSAVGWCVIRFAPNAAGSGIPHVKGVLLHLRQMKWKAILPVKFIGGVLGIGAGLSMGREGPTVQMGAAVGKAIAELLRVPARSTPQLLSCGAGAGVAAAFNAPLAGFLFVIEELHRELSARTFAGALVAALSADIVARALAGSGPSFAIAGYPALPLSALPLAGVIGVVGGLLGVAFNRSLISASSMETRATRVPVWVLPGIAAAVCGLVAWWLPEAVGGGHHTAELLLGKRLHFGLGMLLALLAAKFILTVFSYASGAPGGIFAPMLLLGAIAGAIIGRSSAMLIPSLSPHATAFAILGMAAWFTGSVRAPLTGIVLIVEMTGNYHQLLALGVTCLIADLTAGVMRDRPIYERLLEADLRRKPPAQTESAVAESRSIFIGVQRNSALDGKMIRESGLPRGCLVVSVERGGKDLLPEAGLTLHAGDHLTIMIPDDEPEKSLQVVHLATGL